MNSAELNVMEKKNNTMLSDSRVKDLCGFILSSQPCD